MTPSLRCLIALHDWEKWSDPRKINRRIVGYETMMGAYHLPTPLDTHVTLQDRTCRRCGKYQRREVA